MVYLGIDIGSRSGKIAIVDEAGTLVYYNLIETVRSARHTFESLMKELPEKLRQGKSLVTGYGRVAVEDLVNESATEITCHYLGAQKLFSLKSGTVIDIGGQDSKVIKARGGRIEDFAMNERCAAGTGRFLEVMTKRLGCSLDEFASMDLSRFEPAPINATCTVFAESEIVSLMASDIQTESILAAIAKMTAQNILFMVKRLHTEAPFVMTGGVASIRPVRYFLEKTLGSTIMIHEHSQITGALGAALLARKRNSDDLHHY